MGINVWRFFSLPQFQNSYEKSSSATVAAAEYHDGMQSCLNGIVTGRRIALFMAYPSGPGHHRILTFRAGGGDLSNWSHMNKSHNVPTDYVIVCFDVRSERFTFIYVERICRLINYKGKLAMIYWEDDVDIHELLHLDNDVYTYWEKKRNIGVINELRLWVLEDVKKQEGLRL
ncbi:PREDICTED: F-box protein At2g16450-like [Camelina sativa]|uniref:F-box protein At2g16450-like n=1 Tax=Camelina sativa TaxID=90675 RepID=A0ABM0WF71_CAMSA|nr:PREDICTED: F-box protein At2g16450-like [Camelina sativa]